MKKLLQIEEEIKFSFKRFHFLTQNLTNINYLYNAYIKLNQDIYDEFSKLNLQSYSLKKLLNMKYYQAADFDEIYFLHKNDDLKANIRLCNNIKREIMYRLYVLNLKKELNPSIKEFYYNTLFQYRLVNSFFELSCNDDEEIIPKEYSDAYLRILFSYTGLETIDPQELNVSNWLHGKNFSLSSYSWYEHEALKEWFKKFLPICGKYTIETLEYYYVSSYLKTYLNLASQVFRKDELEYILKRYIENKEVYTYFCKELNNFGMDIPYLRLVSLK